MNIGSFPLQLVRYKFLRGMVITSAKMALWCCKGLWKIQLQLQIRRHFFEIHDVVSWQRDKSFSIKWIPQNVRYGIPCHTQSLHKLCHKIDASDSITLMDKQWRRGYINIYICVYDVYVLYLSVWYILCGAFFANHNPTSVLEMTPSLKRHGRKLWRFGMLVVGSPFCWSLWPKKSEWMAHHHRLTRLASSLTT